MTTSDDKPTDTFERELEAEMSKLPLNGVVDVKQLKSVARWGYERGKAEDRLPDYLHALVRSDNDRLNKELAAARLEIERMDKLASEWQAKFAEASEEIEGLNEFLKIIEHEKNYVGSLILRRIKERDEARAMCAELADALLILAKQTYGSTHAWAGMFSKCECGKAWAFGGNWNECQPTDSCPTCKATKALTRYESWKK